MLIKKGTKYVLNVPQTLLVGTTKVYAFPFIVLRVLVYNTQD